MTEVELKDNEAVFGFVHEYEKCRNGIHIPAGIIVIIWSYYHIKMFIHKYFDKYSPKNVKLSNDKQTIKRISGDNYHTIYCKDWMESDTNSIHKMKIRINHSLWSNGIMLGIASSDVDINRHFRLNINQIYYSLSISGCKYSSENGKEKVCKLLGNNDTIEMVIDFGEQTIKYLINEQDLGIKYENIKTDKSLRYKYLVFLFYQYDSVSIIESCSQQHD